MPRLRITVLGSLGVQDAAGNAIALPGRKAPALVGYLALQAGVAQERDTLAALLWPEATHAHARHNLRQLLVPVRRIFAPPCLTELGEAVAFDPATLEVDALAFEQLARSEQPEALAEASVLYRGDLLAGLGEQSAPYEDWLLAERERLRELALRAFTRLLGHQIAIGASEPAIQTALRLLSLEPTEEAAHRALMRLYARRGRRAAALRQYQLCVAALQRELGVEPEESTGELYREILRSPEAAANRPPAIPAERAAELPIIGRSDQIKRLRAALSRARDGAGGTLLITGEAGIGKTRLVAELVRLGEAAGAWVAVGRCRESERGLPLYPWVAALRGQLPTLDPKLSALLAGGEGRQLARLFPELWREDAALETNAEQHLLLFDALAELVQRLTGDQPAIVVIEDLHWADAMSARFAADFARRRQSATLLVLTVRPEEAVDAPVAFEVLGELKAEGHLEEIPLAPLTRGESENLLRGLGIARSHKSAFEGAVAEICSIGRGNPFVMVEAARELMQYARGGERAGVRLSTRVEDSVGRRLDRLRAGARHLVNIAAVIGRDFSFPLVDRAAGLGGAEAAAAIDELVRRHLLEAVGDRLDFRHEWIRRVVYQRLLPPLRTSAHRAVAEALEAGGGAPADELSNEVGEHYARAGDWRRALPHLVRFAEVAVQRYALDDALAALDDAATGAASLADAERARWQLQIALQQAFVMSLQGRQREILELLQARAGLLPQVDDPALTSDYYTRRALVHWYRGEHLEAELIASEALRAAERAGSPERVGRAQYVLALNCAGLGRPVDGVAHAERAVAILDARPTRHWGGLAYFALALNQVIAGQLDGAARSAERCMQIGKAEEDTRLLSGGGYVAAWVEVDRGNLQLAIDTATRTLRSARDAVATCLAEGVLGWAALEQGDAGTAITHLRPAVDRLRAMPLRQTEGRFLPILSAAYLRAGDRAHATECAQRARELSRMDGNPLTQALAERALGQIARAGGDRDGAAQLFAQALRGFDQIGAKVDAAMARLELAELSEGAGDRAGARALFDRAAADFEMAGALKRAMAAREKSIGPRPSDAGVQPHCPEGAEAPQ